MQKLTMYLFALASVLSASASAVASMFVGVTLSGVLFLVASVSLAVAALANKAQRPQRLCYATERSVPVPGCQCSACRPTPTIRGDIKTFAGEAAGSAYRGTKNKRKPGQMWNSSMKRWEGGPCRKHKAHTACGYCAGDQALNRNRPRHGREVNGVTFISAPPVIEDAIDALAAAWEAVYGKLPPVNRHAVTLGTLRSWHDKNLLTSEQFADCAEELDLVAWAIDQPLPGSRSATVAEGKRRGRSSEQRYIQEKAARRGGGRTLEQMLKTLKETEAAAEATLDRVRKQRDLDCPGCRTETVIGGLHPVEFSYCDGSHIRASR